MKTEIIVNMQEYEKRAAIMEDGELVELIVHQSQEGRILGNIYLGRVDKVVPGIQAAFVDIGEEKKGFLYVKDIRPELTPWSDDDVEVLEDTRRKRSQKRRPAEQQNIDQILKKGQKILAQVSKEPMSTKGPRLTTHISLPGRNVVLLPTVTQRGLSRRIESAKERNRLHDIVKKTAPRNMGLIIRTAAENREHQEIEADIKLLVGQWRQVKRRAGNAKPPRLLHQGMGFLDSLIYDLFTANVEQLVVDDPDTRDAIRKDVKSLAPGLEERVRLHTDLMPIFEHYGLENKVEQIFRKKVWLKCGGYLIIEEMEALTAIDVNTGKYTGKRNMEDTIVRANLEAAKEVARQLRLRDIGGIIVIDFIDMKKRENRDRVLQELKTYLRGDRARSQIMQSSRLGIVEMTRKRVRESLAYAMRQPCPYCDGNGYILSEVTMSAKALREIESACVRASGNRIVVEMNPELAESFLRDHSDQLAQFERRHGKSIEVTRVNDLHYEQVDILTSLERDSSSR